MKSLAFLTSSSVLSGFFENSWTQPPLPQASSLKPLASSRFSSVGVSFSQDVLPFGVGLEEERDAEDVEGIVDMREARAA